MKFNFEKGQQYTSTLTDCNIFIISAYGNSVTYIEGWSPAAIHDKQETDYETLVNYMINYKYELNGIYK